MWAELSNPQLVDIQMKYIKYLAGCATLVLLAGCGQEDKFDKQPEREGEAPSFRAIPSGYNSHEVPGVLYVKIAKEHHRGLRLAEGGEVVMSSVPTQLSSTLSALGASRMTPLFPIDARWEERMRRAGLDEWYEVELSPEQDLGQAVATLSSLQAVTKVEKDYRTSLTSVKTRMAMPSVFNATTGGGHRFNDPGLKWQWHYDNQGKYPRSVVGADINLFAAWEREVGKPNVIVAVTDGGIDTEHEDLKDNMWVNAKEIPDNGIDDDNNGYVDDIHGVNFIHLNGKIYPDADSHGTHVAGTVGARNNNGIGVCGVAGGDGTPNSGVRLMSCQKFGKRGESSSGVQSAKAFVYAANNGAVISQNSWGYNYPGPGYLPAYEREAIDYFIENAGCDNQGRQLPDAPMKGGIVLFAAGNDGKDHVTYPAAYNRVVAVSAMAPNWEKAYYTNRGAWVDIMAPGGDTHFDKGEVYSTVAPSVRGGTKYAYMQGTSMACPHVSGVAALLVSKFGGQGFTNEELKTRLLGALRPMNINVVNSEFVDRLGVGYLDADAAFAENKGIAPNQVKPFVVSPEFITATAQWTSVEDGDDKMPIYYQLYMDERELTERNYSSAKQSVKIKAFGIKPGREMSHLFDGLTDNKDYYFAIEAVDRWGLKSKPTFTHITTKRNTAPTIEGIPEKAIRVTGTDRAKFTLTLKDADGHNVLIKVSGDSKGVAHKVVDNKVYFTIMATAAVGHYKIKVEGRDEIGATVSAEIPFEIYTYKPPVFKANIKPQIVGLKQNKKSIDIAALLEKDPAQQISYEVSTSDGGVLSAEVDDKGLLTMQARKKGKVKVNVLASDGVSKAASSSFEVRVVDNEDDLVYTLYPVPVEKQLNVIVNPELPRATFEVISMLGRRVYNKTYDINGQNHITLSLSMLTPGAYTLKVSSERGVYQRNFVKL